MKKLLIGKNYSETLNNFFDNPNIIREYALKQNFYSAEESRSFSISSGNYAGVRTKEIHLLDRVFFDSFCHRLFSNLIDLTDVSNINWVVSSYFHLQNSWDRVENTIHKDGDVMYAGLIYLTPGIDQQFGTSLYDDEMNLIKSFPNVYNTLSIYDANIYHGPSGFVDDRLTMTFFVKKLEIEYNKK